MCPIRTKLSKRPQQALRVVIVCFAHSVSVLFDMLLLLPAVDFGQHEKVRAVLSPRSLGSEQHVFRNPSHHDSALRNMVLLKLV